jgi:hypothetical protein
MSNPQTQIISGTSGDFDLPPPMLTLSNSDLTAVGGPYELDDYEVSSQAQEIEDQLILLGYFPADTYRLRLELRDHNSSTPLAADEVTAVITNPLNIQLVSPAGTPGSPTLLQSPTPVFAWSSQATQFLLKICEQLSPDMDIESVMQGRPNYETDPASPLHGQSFSYPPSGVLPLEPGHTYFWQVRALVQTSSGLQEYPGAVGAFGIAPSLTSVSLDPQTQRIVLAVQRTLGAGNLGLLNQLSGYQPNGRLILDGAEISIEQLEELALRFEQGAYRTRSVRIE